MRIYDNIHEAYLGTLTDIWDNYEYRCAPRGLPIREKLDYVFRVMNPVSEPIVTKDEERNKVIVEYTQKEFDLYNSCSNNVKNFAKASKFWEKIANPDGTVTSAYGYLIWENRSCGNPIFELANVDEHGRVWVPNSLMESGRKKHNDCMRTPWEWAKQALIADKDTRQAILRFSLPSHQWQGTKDLTCTMHGNFSIREDTLNFSIVMRSNDMMLGIVYDMSWFVHLIDRMIEELKPYYPTLKKGSYTHVAQSAHIYEKDEASIMKMIGR